ncbi:hypothetical protein EAH79_03400 [Sphingomonas koreensis]|nr:hypothetical protein EAH79_03400 [Sphingomonas koreensis]
MVLRRRVALAAAASLAALATPGHAQRIDQTAPIIDLPGQDLPPEGVPLGPFRLYPSAEAGVVYDSNIYASPTNVVGDGVFVLTPRVEAKLDSGPLNLSLLSELQFRRFFKHSTEDSDAATLRIQGAYDLGSTDTLAGFVSLRRAIEDRGDPEASQTRSTGPRRINLVDTEVAWTHDTGRAYLQVRGDASRINYLAPIDSDRDLAIYAGRATAGYYVSGNVRAIVTGFYNRRDFRLATDYTGVNRDADTYGVRAGLNLAQSGFFHGEATVGVFHFAPDDPSLKGRTGLSADISMSYLPSRRLGFTLDGFRGDVATVRNGAQQRTDTRVRLGVQAEARSNLHLQASAFYRHSSYIGTGITERTIGASGEAEYRINRYLAVALTGSYAKRRSDDPSQPFERTRVAIELRSQF